VSTEDRIKHACIQEQFLREFASGSDIDIALHAFTEAADHVDEGSITTTQIKEGYCKCDGVTCTYTEHVCMIDCAVRLCSDMSIDVDGRVSCQGCAPRAPELKNVKKATVWKRISRLAWRVHNTDIHYVEGLLRMELQYSAEEVATSLFPRVISNMEFLDGYGPAQSVLEATYRNGYLRTLQAGQTIPYPLVLSIDKVKPLHMKDGLPALHHPENIVLTRLCINLVKGKDGPSILPWLKRLLQLAKAAKLQPVTADYLPEQLQEMMTFERFADNATIIRRTFAHSNSVRLRDGLAPGYQKTFDEIIAPQFKSGIFCGFVMRGPYKPV